MKILLKNTFRKIKKSIGRFLSIMFIITLGISVFLGLREATTGMLYTADNYYDKFNLMDFKITSTYGFTEDDLKSLKNLKNINKVIGTYSIDVLAHGESIRIHALENELNKVNLIKGRMPKNKTECVADYYKYKLNDKIKFEIFEEDIIDIEECKVVGLIKSPLYIRDEKGISNVGNGKLTSFLFVLKEVFISKYYLDIYLTAKDSLETSSYYEEYNEAITPLKKELVQIKPIRETIRYEEILKKANEEIIKEKNKSNKLINDSIKDLNKALEKLNKGSQDLKLNKEKGELKFSKNKEKLLKNQYIILNKLKENKIEEKELSNYLKNIQTNLNNLTKQLNLLAKDSEEYLYLSNTIFELKQKYNTLEQLKENLDTINENIKKLNNEYNLFKIKIKEEENKLNTGYLDYKKGLKEVEQAQEKLNKKIKEEKEKLNNLEKPVWYLLDRTDNSGYISYKEDIIKVEAISKILPVFFIIVVLLMILNTLTRLIEEDRTEMGILLSNGFSKSNIVFSYLIYVLLAGTIGIGLGLTIGYSLIPRVIYSVFLARFYVPKLITVVSPVPFTLVITVTFLIMLIVTIIACRKELKEVPAMLLRPKPPKTGKKIFIEKFTIIWTKLNFLTKTTIRNLFRYKKRIIMTVLGVAGCTALLLAGLGINDSINSISKIQYKDIIKYKTMFILKEEIKEETNTLKEFLNKNNTKNYMLLNQSAYTFSFNNKTEDVYVIVPKDKNKIKEFINLKSSKNKKEVQLNNGAVITKQLADILNLNVGDSFPIRNSNNELFYIYIKDIVTNYVSHYIYMSDTYYKEIFGELKFNSIITNNSLKNNLNLKDYNILTVNYTKDIIKTFDSFVKGINQIIIMIIIFASFLAFVVLYNLTIINVSERKREIATFKVLGFYNKEISLFVYRETLILTIVGIIGGLFLGVYLHQYIMWTAQTDNIMFLKKINKLSYLLSALITLIFSFIVQLIINKTLKKIDMIDSLKSIE